MFRNGHRRNAAHRARSPNPEQRQSTYDRALAQCLRLTPDLLFRYRCTTTQASIKAARLLAVYR